MVKLYLLGTGTPTPTPESFGTAYVLQIDDEFVMIDCGPAATHKLVKAGLWPTRIDHLLFTHHHFDHNADYPCFLLCRWDQSSGRENRLSVWGPRPTAQLTERLIGPEGAFRDDWVARVEAPVSQSVHANRGGSLPRPVPDVCATDIESGWRHDFGRWSASAVGVHHVQPWLISLAYRIETPAGAIVFAGDTGSVEAVADLAAGCDTLVVNCWDLQATMDANGETPGQTGTVDAAQMAAGAGVRTLVLTHTGPALRKAREQGLAEVAAGFDGRIVFAEELTVLDLF